MEILDHDINVSIVRRPWLDGWRRAAFLGTLLIVSIFSQVDRILPFIMAESIKADLGLSDTHLGLITGLAFTISYSLASLPLARIADKGWARQILLWGIVFWSAMTGMGGLATGFVTLALSRLGVALGEAGGTPASHALIAQNVPAHTRGRAIGLYAMGMPLGTMIGFAFGGWASDTIGWRNVLFGAGAFGMVIIILVALFTTKPVTTNNHADTVENFFQASYKLLSRPAFLWLFIGANLVGFASAPFYIFGAPFLMRTYELTAGEVGLSFGILQGLMGVAGTLLGGRLFDSAINRGAGGIMNAPAILFVIAAVTTLTALFAPEASIAIALFVPGMFAFAFVLPYAFGAGHWVAGPGKQALSSGLLMMGAGLLGSSLSPLLVGLISDAATTAGLDNGLQVGMLVVPVFILLAGIACFVIGRKLKTSING